MSESNCKVWYLNWKVVALAKKLSTQIFDFWKFITSLSPLKWEVSYPRKSGFLFNLDLLALWLIFFANFLHILKGLKCKKYSMDIEVMTVWKKLLADARIGSSRGGHHQYHKHSNPTIILYKKIIFVDSTWILILWGHGVKKFISHVEASFFRFK